MYEEILELTRATGDLRWEWQALLNLTDCGLAEARVAEALPMLERSIGIAHDLNHRKIHQHLWRVAWALALLDQPRTAARLLAFAEQCDQEIGHSLPYAYVSWATEVNAKTLAIVRSQLDEAAFTDAWEQGQELTIDEALALALESVDAARPAGISR